MPTPLDRALNSKNLFLGFTGMVTAAAAWAIWGNEMFPAESDPRGGKYLVLVAPDGAKLQEDPEDWTLDEMRRWLRARGLMPDKKATREELLERIRANLRIPPRSSS